MSEITVPDPDGLILGELNLVSPAQVNRSVWTGARKVVGLTGAEVWKGKAGIDILTTENEERPWRAFLFALGGPANWFRWSLPCNQHIGPKPTVDAGASDGYTLGLNGLQPSTTILFAGQYMTVELPSGRFRAVCLIDDLVADSSGNATATFRPALTEAPDEGTEVETADPFIPMSPVDPTQGFSADNGVAAASFDVEEAR